MAAPQLTTPPVPVPELVWVRPPQQARSQLTLSRILDATEAILAEKSWEDAGVAEIARRAGSSVGAFYSRFRDKDALLVGAAPALHRGGVRDLGGGARGDALDRRVDLRDRARVVAFQMRVYDQRRGAAARVHPVRDPRPELPARAPSG